MFSPSDLPGELLFTFQNPSQRSERKPYLKSPSPQPLRVPQFLTNVTDGQGLAAGQTELPLSCCAALSKWLSLSES